MTKVVAALDIEVRIRYRPSDWPCLVRSSSALWKKEMVGKNNETCVHLERKNLAIRNAMNKNAVDDVGVGIRRSNRLNNKE